MRGQESIWACERLGCGGPTRGLRTINKANSKRATTGLRNGLAAKRDAHVQPIHCVAQPLPCKRPVHMHLPDLTAHDTMNYGKIPAAGKRDKELSSFDPQNWVVLQTSLAGQPPARTPSNPPMP